MNPEMPGRADDGTGLFDDKVSNDKSEVAEQDIAKKDVPRDLFAKDDAAVDANHSISLRTRDNKLQRDIHKEKNSEMLTKTFEPKEMIPFGQLRTLSQKELLRHLEEHPKLGIVIKDQLKVALIDMDKFLELVEAVQEHERLLDWLEERELFERVSARSNGEWEQLPEGMSVLEWAGIRTKG